MSKVHDYSTRRTTIITESISQLAAILPIRKRMTNKAEGLGLFDEMDGTTISLNNMERRMELLMVELTNVREELAQLKLQQSRQGEVSTDLQVTTTTTKVVVGTDPLQQMKDFVRPFHGESNEDVHMWIESIVHYFDVAQLPGSQELLYIQYAPAFLQSYAYKWWKENKRVEWNWRNFKDAIIEQFGKTNEYLIGRQLDQRKQQINEPVIKYYYDIMELCSKYDPTMSDKQKIYKLTDGLRLSLYQEAIRISYGSTTEFLNKVQQIENVQQLIEHRQMLLDQEDQRKTTRNNLQTQAQMLNGWGGDEYMDDSRWNTRRYSYEQQATTNKSNGRLQCHKCHEIGHISRYCPQGNSRTDSIESATQQQKVKGNSEGIPSLAAINPSSLPFTVVPVNNVETKCLVDTGASNTFISSSVLDDTQHSTIIPMNQEVVLASGNKFIRITGKVKIYVRIGDMITDIIALISDSISIPCILGVDWIHKYAVDICYSTEQIIVHSGNSKAVIPLKSQEGIG